MEQPLIVQAEYSFKGGNNDELCFKKGDLITVTQREEGGWWEGTLDDKTGWFPSNYVNEYKAPLPSNNELIRPPEEIQEYRSVVLKDLLESERAHVAELQGLLENFLEPLQQTQILTTDEYAQLMCNFVEIVKTHEELLQQMEDCNDRIGKLFLTKAPYLKQVHQAYCAAHPKAIVILDKHKDELTKYMERQGAATPGLLVLTTGLSKPFRRLDKYSAMLQELERHMESSHPDRGDTQRSVAVFKDIAATCSATRRQKELELQVLTGPVRGWQGQELSSLGDIIHMGSVAVGSDHRDRYFVLFPQTLLILSVSQRMSAFIYEGKLPLTGIVVNRLEDSERFKNAFEISGPLIERIVAICQGPNEANKWVELLTTNNLTVPINIKRQLSNLSNSSISGSGTGGGGSVGGGSYVSQHMSPPTNLNMLNQKRTTSTTPQSIATSIAATSNNNITTLPSPNATQPPQIPQQQQTTTTQQSTMSMSTPLQHKRSLSFNHHLSYNQYTHTPHQQHQHNQQHHQHLHQHQQQPPSLPSHQQIQQQNHKLNLVQMSNSISKNQAINMAAVGTNARIGNTKANWSITNLRPAPPLRPTLLNNSSNNSTSGGGGSTSGGGGSLNALSSYCSGRKMQPNFEEDALVLRVFEAYCAAYQSNARNTIHSALQPWTPCLPIRGGKLKTSKPFSTSNPQLPFLCNAIGGGTVGGVGGGSGGFSIPNQQQQQQQNSTSSLNSSYIWREASPNNFNLYSSSVSSLGGGGSGGYRYSLTGNALHQTGATTNIGGLDYRALSEERATRKSLNRFKSGFGSGYDNIFMTPLLPRKNKTSPKLTKHNAYQASIEKQQQQLRSSPKKFSRNNSEEQPPSTTQSRYPPMPGLYDRRLNRSFETNSRMAYGGCLETTTLRRSTPHLAADDSGDDASNHLSSGNGDRHRGCGSFLGGKSHNKSGEGGVGVGGDNQRHSGTWCCGLENEDMTPTLRQLWTSIRQMQQDMSQMKLQINEERALRVNLQQLLLQHLENNSNASVASSTNSSNNTPKC